MKIRSILLKDFKRFTDLTIQELPDTARLVVLVGPNGSGKSSLFEAFNVYLNQSRSSVSNDLDYFRKTSSLEPISGWNIFNLLNEGKITIQFHDHIVFGASRQPTEADKKAFYIRSCYRQQADFSADSIKKQGDILNDADRPKTLNQSDSRVANNYQRLVADALSGLLDGSYDSFTGKEVRDNIIGAVQQAVERVLPGLKLTGTGNVMDGGTFYFQKGNAGDWKYKNLSGGEKAAFDLLLDFIVKAQAFDNTVFCIDEPETHMHTSVQGQLLRELLRQLPSSCQLWVATHSAGMMRAARDLERQHPGEVVFLDFGGQNFDEMVVMEPSTPDRTFWKRNFEVSLGDLANLVAPAHIVFCEGNGQENGIGFDAQCYERIFVREFPDTEFVSTGGVSDLQKNAFSVSAVMERILSGVKFTTVRDRDDATEQELEDWATQGMLVLSRRTIESYLWDDEILEKLCNQLNQQDKLAEVIALKQRELQSVRQRGYPTDDVKSAAGNIYSGLRRILDTRGLGSTRQAFSRDTLAPLITPETLTYQELRKDIFGSKQ